MIYLYTGTPGSGKSLDLARIILNKLKANKPVICNFNINLPKNMQSKNDLLRVVYDEDISVDYLVKYSREYFMNHKFKEGTITYIIDEAQLCFNARSWNIQGRDKWIRFFSNHRHLGYDIILCCQFDMMIDKQIRSLVEYEVIHRKASNMGWKGKLISAIMLAPQLFVRVKIWYPMQEKVDSMFYRFEKKYSYIYDSYDNFMFSECDIGGVTTTAPHSSSYQISRGDDDGKEN